MQKIGVIIKCVSYRFYYLHESITKITAVALLMKLYLPFNKINKHELIKENTFFLLNAFA